MNKKNFKEEFSSQPVAELPPISNKQLRAVYCSCGFAGDANWIVPLGFKRVATLEKADVAIFGGGKDIDPGWYNEKIGSHTSTPSHRDKEEKADFDEIQKLRSEGHEIFSVGLCRGAQLGCALSGGALIQDIGNHFGNHGISTFDRKEFVVNSIHHQMLYPYKMDRKDYKILAWSTKNLSSKYLDGWDREKWRPEGFKEIEIAYFPKTHFLAIQSHPEMMHGRRDFDKTMEWIQSIFLRFYNDKK